MSRSLAQLRRPTAIAAVSTLLLAGGADVALAAPPAAADARLYACVTSDFKTLNLTTRGGRCEAGQQKISWAIEGPRGKTGPRGARGATGKTGAAGPQGAKGETGATGPQGPAGPAGSGGSGGGATGPAGPQGPIGLTGPVGPIGPAGPAGPQGDPGSAGATGARGDPGAIGPQGVQGDPGPAGATLATSSGHATLTTRSGGLVGDVTALPLNGVRASALTYTGGTAAPFTASQIVAATTTFTRLRLEGRLTSAMALIGTTVTPRATLVVNDTPTGLDCDAAPALTGILTLGTSFSAVCTGNVTLNAGDLAHVAVSATAAGITLINTVEADVTASLG
ncbi:MAG TPA: hypothetical protein VLK58_05560 [Conexibacter sp.]|nr:hypothetical protein [Conexibacter sp.]